jgi:hypothetical protein
VADADARADAVAAGIAPTRLAVIGRIVAPTPSPSANVNAASSRAGGAWLWDNNLGRRNIVLI